MADAVQTQGGGEQATPVADTQPASPPEATPAVTPSVKDTIKKEEPEVNNQVPAPEAIPTETPVAEIKKEPETPAAEIKKEPETPATEIKKEPETPAAEIKKEPEQSQETIPEANTQTAEKILTEGVDVKPEIVEVAPEVNDQPAENNEVPKETGDWQSRESVLLKKIEELEKVKNERSADGLKLELKLREEEIEFLKARVKNLEMELQAALSKPTGKNHEIIENIKQQHEELLSKARGMIFDKTKMVKNQELQIEALTTQVQSLKDINVITKDLLEIRNSEVKAMEDRFQAMEAKFKAEKQRYDLVLQRAQTSTTINDDLRKEYETQLGIFKELREKYEQRVQALVAENNRLKESLLPKGGTSG